MTLRTDTAISLAIISFAVIIFLVIIILSIPVQVQDSEIIVNIACQPPLNTVPNYDTLQPCLNITGAPSTIRFYDPNNNWTVEAIDPRFALPAKQACLGRCTEIQNNICVSNDTEYQNCLAQLAPQDCNGAVMPVARKDATYLYVSGTGRVNCF